MLEIAGAFIVGIVVAQSGVLFVSSFRRAYHEREQDRFRRDHWVERIEREKVERLRAERSKLAWQGVRKFEVRRKTTECEGVTSLYLHPHDMKPLPSFLPGQYIKLHLKIPGRKNKLLRLYSLSDSPTPEYYRITVKRLAPSPFAPEAPVGVGSNFIHDEVKAGDILDVEAPAGSFALNTDEDAPLALIAGGVGVTPMLSMLNTLAERELRSDVRLYYGVRNHADHIMKRHLEHLVARNPRIKMEIFYSRPAEGDVKGTDYDIDGRLDAGALKDALRTKNCIYYLCGPGRMMSEVEAGLLEQGVQPSAIRAERFGPESKPKTKSHEPETAESSVRFTVNYDKSKKVETWRERDGTLLEHAHAHEIDLDCACRTGKCGMCLVAIRSGEIEYTCEPEFEHEFGVCLACIAKPKSDLSLDI